MRFLNSQFKKSLVPGTSLVVQWLRLHAPSARGMGSIPGWGTKTLHATWHGQKNPTKIPSAYESKQKALSPVSWFWYCVIAMQNITIAGS